ncbi:MAG: phosphatidylserine decarboxylase [bacterium]|nr:phosphatidylserine decarboxylase [bacterium]
MKIPFAKEGYPYIFVPSVALVLSFILHYYAAGSVFLLVCIFMMWFFRQPGRRGVYKNGTVLSPADGRIVQIKRVIPGYFIEKEVTRVSIFMSVFDMHVNLAPIEGKIVFMEYSRGGHLNALDARASELNEACAVGFEKGKKRVLIKQIAGLIARRVKNCVKISDKISAGDKIGIIMFGSRVDVFLDDSYVLKVRLGERVKAGLTVIGEST